MRYFLLPFMVLFLCVSFSVEGQRSFSDSETSGRRSTSSRSKRSARSGKRSARSGNRSSNRKRRSRRSRSNAEQANGSERSARSGRRSARSGRGRGASATQGVDSTTGRRSRGSSSSAATATGSRRSARSGRGGGASATEGVGSTTGRRSRGSSSSVTTATGGRRSARSGRGGGTSSVAAPTQPAASARRGRGGIATSPTRSSAPARSGSVLTTAETPLIHSEPAMTVAPTASEVQAVPTMTTATQMYAQPQTVDKEEQLLVMEEGKARFQACMDDFCNDTDSVNPAGRCLCSANIAKLKPLEDSVHKKMKQLFQMTSNVDAAKLGMQYELFDQSVLDKMGIKEDEDEETPWDIDNVDYGIEALLEGETKRKEGKALFKDAMAACKPYLDATSSFKKYLVSAYEASAQKSCRAYENSLTDKLRRYDLAMQSTYNKLQKTEQKTTNAYNASKCSQKLHACMVEKAQCGENFSNCSTREHLEERKLYCKSETLDKCQSVADTVWEEFVNNAVRIGAGAMDEQSAMCARNLRTCFEEGGYCGEDNIECATAAMMENKKSLCYDTIASCDSKADSLWAAFVSETVSKGSATKAALDQKMHEEELAQSRQDYQQCASDLQACAVPKCGKNALECRTAEMAENIKGLCAATLAPCGNDADSIWNSFVRVMISKGSAAQAALDEKARIAREKRDAANRAKQEKLDAIKNRQDIKAKQTRYQKCVSDLQRCATPKCGTNGANCRTSDLAENVRGLCASTLIPCGQDGNTIWDAFKKGIMAKGAAYQKQLDDRAAADVAKEEERNALKSKAEEERRTAEESRQKVEQCRLEKRNFESCVRAKCGSTYGVSCEKSITTCSSTHFKGSCESYQKDDMIADYRKKIIRCSPGEQVIGGRCRKALVSSPAPTQKPTTTTSSQPEMVTVQYGYYTCSSAAKNCAKWRTKSFPKGEKVSCSNSAFGGDPAKYKKKLCRIGYKTVAKEGESFIASKYSTTSYTGSSSPRTYLSRPSTTSSYGSSSFKPVTSYTGSSSYRTYYKRPTSTYNSYM